MNNFSINKPAARESFNRAASSYDKVAVLQREVGGRLIERLELVRIEPQHILDIGCGTGEMTMRLSRTYRKAQIVALDFAEQMILLARNKQTWKQKLFNGVLQFVCADAEVLPFKDSSVDFIFSNLALQWCTSLDNTFREFRRILKPGGLLMFSTLGPDTLKELRASWQAVDHQQHVHSFVDMHDVGDAMIRSGLADPVMDVEHFTLTYSDVMQLMRELKQLGAHNAAVERPHQLTGKQHLKRMLVAYEQLRTDGKIPASYEVVYGHAWCPEVDKSNSTRNQSITVEFHGQHKEIPDFKL